MLAERELRLELRGARSSHLLKKKRKSFPQALKRSDAAGFMSELKLRPPLSAGPSRLRVKLKLRPPKAKSRFLAALGMTLGGTG